MPFLSSFCSFPFRYRFRTVLALAPHCLTIVRCKLLLTGTAVFPPASTLQGGPPVSFKKNPLMWAKECKMLWCICWLLPNYAHPPCLLDSWGKHCTVYLKNTRFGVDGQYMHLEHSSSEYRSVIGQSGFWIGLLNHFEGLSAHLIWLLHRYR